MDINELEEERELLRERLRLQAEEIKYKNFVEEMNYYKRQRVRRSVTIAVAISVVFFSISLIYFDIGASSNLIATIGMALVIIIGAFSYLQSNSINREALSNSAELHELRYYIEKRLDEALKEVKSPGYKPIEFSEQDKAKILTNLQQKLESDSLKRYMDEVKELILEKAKEETLDSHLVSTKRRLTQEVQELSRRGNLNLVLGITTTLAGLGVLGYAVFNPPDGKDYASLLAHFVPRISLVLLIEIFAYFFLRLYKQSLSEIKYFQNELTNIESKHLALQIALRDEDKGLRSKIVDELGKTERNFVLSKGQTTVDLERERITSNAYKGVTDMLKDIVKSKKG